MNVKRLIITVILFLYVISPLDLMPGLPFDDLIAIAFGIWQMRLPSEA